jgi:diaminohydroxyphosphoribosylaminopyrimidine deaminase/5-amino-6-(5-phosphoribosylamino)uracil reductase
MALTDQDQYWMHQALGLALRGEGQVEPNPMVGCLIARDDQQVSEGWHARFGGPHAEAMALEAATGPLAEATLYVTLEPCCHHGKTPPCSDAIIDSGIRRVVVADIDPSPRVNGAGIRQLEAAGLEVHQGLLQEQARALLAPYRKTVRCGKPWVIAKWAMTLDGRIATRTGSSQWISSEASRQVVHELRGRVDAIIVGRRTVIADDPLLTARPPGPRIPLRVVVTNRGELPAGSQLLLTAAEFPLLVSCGPEADPAEIARLEEAGCEVLQLDAPQNTIPELLLELGKRQMTNVLVEGGSQLLGAFRDGDHVDEVHVFMAPKLVGGDQAPGPLGGIGSEKMADALSLENPQFTTLENDVYLHGRLAGRSQL